MERPRFACSFRPGFTSGVMAIGAALYLYENGLRPEMITGTSGGGLAAASVAPWNNKVMRTTLKQWSHLTPSKISKMNWADDAFLLSIFAVPALHLLPPFASSNLGKKIEQGVKAALSLAFSLGSLKAVFRQPAFFTSDPLRELLETNVDWENIFGPDAVKLAVMAAKQRDGQRTVYTNFLEGDKDREKLMHGLLSTSAIVPGLPPQSRNGEKEIDGIFAHGDFLGIDLIEHYVDVDHILAFLFYDLPFWREPRGNMEEQDHVNEIVVRDEIDSILKELPPETSKKIIRVVLPEPPRKIDMRNFTHADMRSLISLGYMATEMTLKEHGWV